MFSILFGVRYFHIKVYFISCCLDLFLFFDYPLLSSLYMVVTPFTNYMEVIDNENVITYEDLYTKLVKMI